MATITTTAVHALDIGARLAVANVPFTIEVLTSNCANISCKFGETLNCVVNQLNAEANAKPSPQLQQIPRGSANGCGARFAPGQWWGFCGETDMGQGMPARCTSCGGSFLRAES